MSKKLETEDERKEACECETFKMKDKWTRAIDPSTGSCMSQKVPNKTCPKEVVICLVLIPDQSFTAENSTEDIPKSMLLTTTRTQ